MPPRSFAPKDATRREHLARVTRVIHRSASDDYCVLELEDGGVAVGPANADAFARGTVFRFLGRWEDDAARGPRFKFQTFTVHRPGGRFGVTKFLTETCENIGQKTAEKLFAKYGDAAVATLRDEPAKVAEECGINPQVCAAAAVELETAARFAETRVELFDLFRNYGFSGRLVDDVIELWGAKAPTIIRKNPFRLLGMTSAGFKRCDRMWAELKLPQDALKRRALCVVNVLRHESQGHTWMTAADLAAKLRDVAPVSGRTGDPRRDAKKEVAAVFKFGLRARLLKKRRDAGNVLWLADYDRATAEERIAAAVWRLADGAAAGDGWPVDRVPVSKAEGDGLPTRHQVEQLRRATVGPLGLFIGGPGTGKTFSLSFLLKSVAEIHGPACIGVVAPTGKAAVRATQALSLAGIDVRAKTIHTTLGIGRNGHDGDGWDFAHGAGNPLPFRFLVGDETSMDDTTLLACLLDAMATGTRVLLVGDHHQLPPVGHGAPLRDLIAAGVPCGELTEVQRNAGSIVRACAAIKAGGMFTTDDVVDLAPVPPAPPKNLKFVAADSDAHAVDQLVSLLKRMTKFDPVWQTQVIVARNAKGDVSRRRINDRLHPLLNPDGYAVDGCPFKVGDKIICTRNSWMQRVEPVGEFGEGYADDMRREAGNYLVVFVKDEEGERTADVEEVYVANGEIGRVVAVGKGLMVARFSEAEALVKVPVGKVRERDEGGGGDGGDGDGAGGDGSGGGDGDGGGGGGLGCNCDLAYAISGHKMQGAEAPCVVVMGDEGGGSVTSREWLYTSISRASKLCVLVGKMETFRRMVGRVSLGRRKTFLRELVDEVMGRGRAGGVEGNTNANTQGAA